MQTVCMTCKGQKKTRGIGCLITICKACNGKGLIEHIHDVNTAPSIIKRTKRKKADEEEAK